MCFMNHVFCVAAWGLAGPAATSSWMSCWTWQSVKEWWISTTVSKPSAPAASTWSRQRSGQVHDNTSHSNQVKYLNTVLHMLKEVGTITSLSLALLENRNRIRNLNSCFPLMLFVNSEYGWFIIIFPLWDLCKGHCNNLREKTHTVSQCAAQAHTVLYMWEYLHIPPLIM